MQGCGHVNHTVQIHYFFKKSFYLLLGINAFHRIIMMWVYINDCNFMTPRVVVLVLKRGHISHVIKVYFLLKILSTLGHISEKVVHAQGMVN